MPAGLVAAMLALFLVVEALDIALLTDPGAELAGSGAVAAAGGVGLLIADVVLPVPSSLVMLLHGAVFGAVVGAALSLAGSVGAFAAGFGLGRRGAEVVGRVVGDDERRRADRLLRRWGVLAIIVSRPVPMLAETTAIVAGTSSLPWGPALAAAVVGALPGAVLYAVAGAAAASFATGAVVFGVVLALGAAVALLARADRLPAGGGEP